jgi:hypothetical protein
MFPPIFSPSSMSFFSYLLLTFFLYREETGLWTDCVGDCGTPGWRLLSETIDSGDGHGALADVNLYVRIALKLEKKSSFRGSSRSYSFYSS